jgi:hypothetical protein
VSYIDIHKAGFKLVDFYTSIKKNINSLMGVELMYAIIEISIIIDARNIDIDTSISINNLL